MGAVSTERVRDGRPDSERRATQEERDIQQFRRMAKELELDELQRTELAKLLRAHRDDMRDVMRE
ncbi:hypothetical protein RZS08_39870, partial [Arthrospira platensis SPKY1]|nr:hypothetical protein [Arthrospira platensis SPKY1]